MATTKAKKAEEIEEARGLLLRWFPRGSTVYTILRHVSRSGMQREVSVLAFQDGHGVIHPNHATHVVTGRRIKRGGMHDALVVNGCGFDAGYDIADAISVALYGKSGELRHEWL